MKVLRRICLSSLLLLPTARPLARDVVPPQDFGRVVLDNFSSRAGVPPVTFDHWRHRSRFTCRLCHVDVGFAMSAGATQVSASTNRDGFHCGACHNGRTTSKGKAIFPSCSASRNVDESGACRRCHGRADPSRARKEYAELAAGLPRRGTGGAVDWEAAEASWLIKPSDYLEGVSIKRTALRMEKDVPIESMGWMADVVFSHKKHAVWNGCEVCHPQIYPSTKRGTVKYSMLQISSGESCGVCHDKVAFPLSECERCHASPGGSRGTAVPAQ